MPFVPARLFTLFLSVCGAAHLSAAGLPPGTMVGDTFTAAAGKRPAESSLIGQLAEKGGVTWTGAGKLVLTAEGSVTVANTEAAMGLLPLLTPEQAMDLSADLLPAGAGFVALALLPDRSPGDFWKTSAVWVLLHGNGDYEIYAEGTTKLLKKGTGADYAFKNGEFNHVEIFCDPSAKTVGVKLNGTEVLASTVLAELPTLDCAAFRFNENAKPLAAKVDNFAVSPAPVQSR